MKHLKKYIPYLTTEQVSSLYSKPLVPIETKQAIQQIEKVFSYLSATGLKASENAIQGFTYDINATETDQRNYIQKTIGLENWFKINEDLRSQIYSFAYQSDSGKRKGDDKIIFGQKWIASLDQSVTGVNNRSKIVLPNYKTVTEQQSEDHLESTPVQEAIGRIKKACQDGSINGKLSMYKTIVDEQYKSIDENNPSLQGNYKYIWKYRPIALERLINGESWSDVEKDWRNSFNPKSVTQSGQSTTTQSDFKKQSTELVIDQSCSNWRDLMDKVKAIQNISIDEKTIEVNLDKSPFTFKCKKGNTKVFLLKLVFNTEIDNGEIPSAQRVIDANKTDYPNSKILSTGTFQQGERNWAVVGLMK